MFQAFCVLVSKALQNFKHFDLFSKHQLSPLGQLDNIMSVTGYSGYGGRKHFIQKTCFSNTSKVKVQRIFE